MLKFQCDRKRLVRKTVFFGFCVEMSSFFAKISARVKKLVGFTCRLCVMKLLGFLVHGKSMVRCAKTWNFFQEDTIQFDLN